jgi:hypothetical protein
MLVVPQSAGRLGERARELAHSRFGIERMLTAYDDWYRATLPAHGRNAARSPGGYTPRRDSQITSSPTR